MQGLEKPASEAVHGWPMYPISYALTLMDCEACVAAVGVKCLMYLWPCVNLLHPLDVFDSESGDSFECELSVSVSGGQDREW